MQIGLDTFTLHPYGWSDPFQFLSFAKEHELDGVQLGGVRSISATLDRDKLREVHAQARGQGLYCHVSVGSPDPHAGKQSSPPEQVVARLTEEIEAAAAAGWSELHSAMGGLDERMNHAVPWAEHLRASMAVLRSLAPVLRHHGCRINLENHGDATTFELVRIAQEVGPDIAGICLDTANVLCHGEDPLAAARRAAPYTHLTHCKDGIIYLTDHGYTRQGRPPGQGVLPWGQIMAVLAYFEPDLTLSIEDHKWVWEFPVFDPQWLAHHPDVTREELAKVTQTAWECTRKIRTGELPDPETYEAIPFKDQLVERLHAGRDHLKRLRDSLGRRESPNADRGTPSARPQAR